MKTIQHITEWSHIKSEGKDQRNSTTLSNDGGNYTSWSPMNSGSAPQNLILKNKVILIRSTQSLTGFGSLAVQVEISLLMAGESTFYLLSRTKEDFSLI